MEPTFYPSMNPEHALFEGKLQGLVLVCYENERPLQGLVGLMDWRFHGVLSSYFRKGIASGKVNETLYVPLQKNKRTFHLFLIGNGHTPESGKRTPPHSKTLENLVQNLKSLKLENIGISKEDFGSASDDFYKKNLKGVSVCITQ